MLKLHFYQMIEGMKRLRLCLVAIKFERKCKEKKIERKNIKK